MGSEKESAQNEPEPEQAEEPGDFKHLKGSKIDDWMVKQVLGAGANGVVFLVEKMAKVIGEDGKPQEKKMAGVMKIPLGDVDSLLWEQNVMQKVQNASNLENRNFHLVRMLEHGKAEVVMQAKAEPTKICYVVMECTPDNPVNFIPKGDKQFTTLGRCSVEMLKGIYDLHQAGFLHRDLKPENMGNDKENHVVIYDLGMARRFLQKDGRLRPPRSYCGFRGTNEWASLFAEDGRDQGQVDDLIAWLYVLNEWTNCLSGGPQAWTWLDDPYGDPEENDNYKQAFEAFEKDRNNLCQSVRFFLKTTAAHAYNTLDGCPQAFYRMKLYLHTLGRNDVPDFFYLALLAHEVKEDVKRISKPEPLDMDRAKIDLDMLNLSLL